MERKDKYACKVSTKGTFLVIGLSLTVAAFIAALEFRKTISAQKRIQDTLIQLVRPMASNAVYLLENSVAENAINILSFKEFVIDASLTDDRENVIARVSRPTNSNRLSDFKRSFFSPFAPEISERKMSLFRHVGNHALAGLQNDGDGAVFLGQLTIKIDNNIARSVAFNNALKSFAISLGGCLALITAFVLLASRHVTVERYEAT